MQKMTLIFALLTSMLVSCSWHLRGSVDSEVTSSVKALSLSADDIYTPLYRTFKNEYENRRIVLENTEDQPQLKLLGEEFSTHILSLDAALNPAEDEIGLLIHYKITKPGQLSQSYNLQLYRTFTENKNRAAARDNERVKLVDEMRREASEKILNQIRTILQAPDTNNAP